MTEFVVKKSSWHYKLNVKMATNRFLFNNWLLYDASFCSYFWLTIFKLIFLIAAMFIACSLVFMLGYVFYLYPWEFMKAVAFLTAISAAFIASFFGIIFVGKFFEKTSKQKSFFGTKYDSWKHKYCPSIRVEN